MGSGNSGSGSRSDATFQINSDEVGKFVKALRAHADKTALGRDLRKGLAIAAGDRLDELSDALRQMLPKKGGLADLIHAEARWTVVARSGRWAGLWIRAVAKDNATKKQRDLRAMMTGSIRHPVYESKDRYPNRPARWVIQSEGIDTEVLFAAIERMRPELTDAAMEVLNDIATRILKEADRG